MFGKKNKKNKSKTAVSKFIKLLANGAEVNIINCMVYNADGINKLEIVALDTVEDLHFEKLDFEIITTEKTIKISGKFDEAYQKKRFKIYEFIIEDYKEFFV